MEKYQSEWQLLNEKYEREEVHDMDARAKMVNEFEKEIDNMYCEHFEKYSTAKDRLEEELQVRKIINTYFFISIQISFYDFINLPLCFVA